MIKKNNENLKRIKNKKKAIIKIGSFSFEAGEEKDIDFSLLTEAEKEMFAISSFLKDITNEAKETALKFNFSDELKKELDEVKARLSQTEEIAEKSSKENERLTAENSKLKKELDEVKKASK